MYKLLLVLYRGSLKSGKWVGSLLAWRCLQSQCSDVIFQVSLRGWSSCNISELCASGHCCSTPLVIFEPAFHSDKSVMHGQRGPEGSHTAIVHVWGVHGMFGTVCATHRMVNPTAVQHPAKALAPMAIVFSVRFFGCVVLVGG